MLYRITHNALYQSCDKLTDKAAVWLADVTVPVVCLLFMMSAAVQASALSLTSTEKKWLSEHPVIRVCVDPSYAPIEFIDNGQHQGITAGYYKLIGKHLGVQFQLVPTPSWKACLTKVKDGSVDVITTIKKTPERETFLNFTQPYIVNDVVIITSMASDLTGEQNIRNFYGKKVAVVKGYFYEDLLPKEHPQIKIMPVESTSAGLISVAFGETDAFFSSYPIVTYYMKKKGISNLTVVGNTPYQADYGVGVRKDWPMLAKILNKSLAAITPTEHDAIKSEWISIRHTMPWYNKTLVIQLLAAAGGILLLGMFWIVLLRRQVSHKTERITLENEQLQRTLDKKTRELEDTHLKLRALSEMDGVTQVANQRFLMAELERFISQSKNQATKQTVTVALVNIDFFQRYNDKYGHMLGDNTLCNVADELKIMVQPHDGCVTRYQNAALALMTPNLSLDNADTLIRHITQRIEALSIFNERSPISDVITVSVGGVFVADSSSITLTDLLTEAENALKSAKHAGRNCYRFTILD